jgi:MtaA/CmuA family methyltransferase
MTSRERMRKVFTNEVPDRVPFSPTIYIDHACLVTGYRFEDALIDPSRGAKCMLEAALKYKADAVRFCLGPEESWYQNKIVKDEDGGLVQYDKATGRREGIYDVSGGGKFIEAEPPESVKTITDVNRIEVLKADDYLERGCLDTVKQCVDRSHENDIFAIGMSSSQTINFMVAEMGSTEAALLCFYDDPDLALALIDKAVEISIEKGKAFIRAGVDCLYIGDSYASASVISPEIYERFCAPAYKTVAAEFHAQGVFCYKHCCGYYDPLLKSLPFIGIDGMDGIDPTSGMTMKHTKEVIGLQLTLMGGISCLTLADGTPEQVYREAELCIRDGMPGGRYVLGSACAVPRKTPFENLFAARRAAEDFGTYKAAVPE